MLGVLWIQGLVTVEQLLVTGELVFNCLRMRNRWGTVGWSPEPLKCQKTLWQQNPDHVYAEYTWWWPRDSPKKMNEVEIMINSSLFKIRVYTVCLSLWSEGLALWPAGSFNRECVTVISSNVLCGRSLTVYKALPSTLYHLIPKSSW